MPPILDTLLRLSKVSILYPVKPPQGKVVKGYAPVMPSYQGLLSDSEITAIIEYIKTLK